MRRAKSLCKLNPRFINKADNQLYSSSPEPTDSGDLHLFSTMIDVAYILALLSKGLVSGIGSFVAQKGLQGVNEWLKEAAKKDGRELTPQEFSWVEAMLASDKAGFWKAQFKLTNRRGIAVIGPSGAGKTALWSHLTEGQFVPPLVSTPERENKDVRFGARYVRVTDTPGSEWHVDIKDETYDFINQGDVDVLILVLANGYLDTTGLSGFRRPGSKTEIASSLEGYHQHCLDEEAEWLDQLIAHIKEPKPRIPYLMVLINKIDQWIPQSSEVLEHYQVGPPSRKITEIANKLCPKGVGPTYHLGACTYDAFKGTAPLGAFSQTMSRISMKVLRTEIIQRLIEQ